MDTLIRLLAIPQLGINIVDIICLLVILIYAFEGYSLGFISAVLDLISLILSFIVALKLYGFVSSIIIDTFSFPLGFANAGSFFAVAILTELGLNLLLKMLFKRFFRLDPHSKSYQAFAKWNSVLGALPGIGSAFVILSFLLSTIISLPSSPFIKHLIATSRSGSVFVARTASFEKNLNDVFGEAFHDTLNFLTIEPQGNEVVNLKFRVSNGTVDSIAEQEMFRLVNRERVARGVPALTFDTRLRDLARAYSQDMLSRGYFSHYSLEGKSPFDRMQAAGITYSYAGENLALAPSTELAMQGLMNSKGHRENILRTDFRKIGIGVIDGGIYGKMYTQEFTD